MGVSWASAGGGFWFRECGKPKKWRGNIFPAKRPSDRRPPVGAVSFTLPRSPVSSPSGDEVPHIATRKSRLLAAEFLISSAKRVLQHDRADSGHEARRQGMLRPAAKSRDSFLARLRSAAGAE